MSNSMIIWFVRVTLKLGWIKRSVSLSLGLNYYYSLCRLLEIYSIKTTIPDPYY